MTFAPTVQQLAISPQAGTIASIWLPWAFLAALGALSCFVALAFPDAYIDASRF